MKKIGSIVLIVVDDANVQRELRDLVTRNGHLVEGAESWSQAKDVLSRIGRPCLVVVDALMPGANEFAYEVAFQERCAVATIPTRLARVDGEVVKQTVHLDIVLESVRAHCGDALAAAR